MPKSMVAAIAQAIDVRDVSDAIDERARDRDDAGEHEDAISREAISGDAEIWTERFASRLRDPGEPISRSKAGFERLRSTQIRERRSADAGDVILFAAPPVPRGQPTSSRPHLGRCTTVQHKCSISAAWMSSKRPVFVQCLSSGQ